MFAAVSIIMGLMCIGLTVDLGRHYFLQRDLQRMANMAALDAARVSGGCNGSMDDPVAGALNEAIGSVVRNGGDSGWVGSDVLVGSRGGDGGVRFFDGAMLPKNRAVQVKLTRPAPGRLIPLLGSGGPQNLSAITAAFSRPAARVKVGGRLLGLNPVILNALLSDQFGPVGLDLLSYQNLFDANLPLSAILDQLPGAPGDAIDDPTAPADFLGALADALAASGFPSAAQAADAIRDASAGGNEVTPGEVLGVDGSGDFTEDSLINAGDTILALGALANEGEVMGFPLPGLPAPLGTPEVRAVLTDPGAPETLAPDSDPSSSSYVRNSQGNVEVDLPLSILGAPVSGLALFLQVAPSRARVSRIVCQRRGLDADSVWVVAQSGISRIGIGRFDDINSPNPTIQPATVLDTTSINVLLGALPVNLTITIAGEVAIQSQEQEMPVFEGPFPDGGSTQTLDGQDPAEQLVSALGELPSSITVDVSADLPGVTRTPLINAILAPLLAGIKASVLSQVLALLDSGALADDLLTPVLQPLGLSIGTADVTVYAVVAKEPVLFTR